MSAPTLAASIGDIAKDYLAMRKASGSDPVSAPSDWFYDRTCDRAVAVAVALADQVADAHTAELTEHTEGLRDALVVLAEALAAMEADVKGGLDLDVAASVLASGKLQDHVGADLLTAIQGRDS